MLSAVPMFQLGFLRIEAFVKTRILLGAFCLCVATLAGQSAVVYVDGPAFPVPAGWGLGSGDLDLDKDGVVDLGFWSRGMLCTTDIPVSGCGWPFYVWTAGTNELLLSGNEAQPRLLGEWIGGSPPPGNRWAVGSATYEVTLANWWYSLAGRDIDGQLEHYGWSGGIADAGIGYLGVRFYASDGAHYAWVRVRLPRAVSATVFEATPVVVDWAYETRANTPIRAGCIGANVQSVEFKVEFFDLGGHRLHTSHVGDGSLILTGGLLRGEFDLVGKYAAAELQGPGDARRRTKPICDFGLPLICRTNRTSFFGEATLTRAQLMALARGLLCVNVDDGDVLGLITPVDNERATRR